MLEFNTVLETRLIQEWILSVGDFLSHRQTSKQTLEERRICIHRDIHAYTDTYIQTQTCIHRHIHAYTHAYTGTHVHTETHACKTHTCM